MKLHLVVASSLLASSTAFSNDLTLYYQTADYATMACKTPQQTVVANAITHGTDFGDKVDHKRWLNEQMSAKNCLAVPPAERFLTSDAKAIYRRSINNVGWAVQIILPGAPSKSLGWVPIEHIRFIPIPSP